MTRRVVITGLGLVCGVGHTAPEVWANLMNGVSGMAPIQGFDTTGFPVTFAAEVKNFDPLQFVDKKEARKMGRFIHFAFAATQEALTQSGLQITEENAERVGVFIGSGIGGFEIIEREHTNLMNGGPRRISPFFIPAAIVNMAAGQVSIRYGAQGPISATATACATSANSIGDSFRLIQHGDADVMIAGGAEAAVTPMSVGGFSSMKALSSRNDDPTHACRPFDKDRDGFVIGEGAGILVLEELEHAKARGAKILGEVVGYGMSADAYHMTSVAPEGLGAQRAMRAALKDAGLAPEQVGYINAHATSTSADSNESLAIEKVFGEHALSHKLKISGTKSMHGHLLGGAGGLEAGISTLALINQKLPPTINLENLDPECRLDYVPNKAVDHSFEYALSNSFGFGGINASLIMKRWME
ncbi:beta-ketoacyl-ACP synthase II [Telmatobacter bradus]|uniref:beta-ketoacyl-ACP synthase II n=1 Tax=Telmatobacter bradus TaxID=474953 RepID=UPI003B42E985